MRGEKDSARYVMPDSDKSMIDCVTAIELSCPDAEVRLLDSLVERIWFSGVAILV